MIIPGADTMQIQARNTYYPMILLGIPVYIPQICHFIILLQCSNLASTHQHPVLARQLLNILQGKSKVSIIEGLLHQLSMVKY